MPQSYSGGRTRNQQLSYNTDPGTYDPTVGGIQYLAGGKNAIDDQMLRDFEAQQESQRTPSLAALQDGFLSSPAGISASGPTITDPAGSPTTAEHIAGVTAPDMTDANAQIFGRAKDQAGQLGRASLQSLRDELGATGMLGSGSEAQSTADIAAKGLGQLGEVSRTNAVNEAAQKADFAKMKYQGDISQRGQDMADQQARASLAAQQAMQQAQLQLQRETSRQQMLLEALRSLNGGNGVGGSPMGTFIGGLGGKVGGGGNAGLPVYKPSTPVYKPYRPNPYVPNGSN